MASESVMGVNGSVREKRNDKLRHSHSYNLQIKQTNERTNEIRKRPSAIAAERYVNSGVHVDFRFNIF